MDDLKCGEDNEIIADCTPRLLSVYSWCRHSVDVWLQCKGEKTKVGFFFRLFPDVSVPKWFDSRMESMMVRDAPKAWSRIRIFGKLLKPFK